MEEALFEQLVQSVTEMKAIERGELKPGREYAAAEITGADAAAIRGQMHLSQGKFAALLGISVDTLQGWEQGRRQPDGPARKLLQVAARRPSVLLELADHPPEGLVRKAARKAIPGGKKAFVLKPTSPGGPLNRKGGAPRRNTARSSKAG